MRGSFRRHGFHDVGLFIAWVAPCFALGCAGLLGIGDLSSGTTSSGGATGAGASNGGGAGSPTGGYGGADNKATGGSGSSTEAGASNGGGAGRPTGGANTGGATSLTGGLSNGGTSAALTSTMMVASLGGSIGSASGYGGTDNKATGGSGSSTGGLTSLSSGGTGANASSGGSGSVGALSSACSTALNFDMTEGIAAYFTNGMLGYSPWHVAATTSNDLTLNFGGQLDTKGRLTKDTLLCSDCIGGFLWYSELGPGPMVGVNPTANVMNVFDLPTPANTVFEHPGEDGQYAVVYWTAPCSGTASIQAVYLSLKPTTTDVHVLVRGKLVFTANINTPADAPLYSGNTNVLVGDQVAFAVGFGANGNFGADMTGVRATIQLLPP